MRRKYFHSGRRRALAAVMAVVMALGCAAWILPGSGIMSYAGSKQSVSKQTASKRSAKAASSEYTVKQWGQDKLNDTFLNRYNGKYYDYYIKGIPYNHCTGYVSWALRKAYGIPEKAFPLDKPMVRNIRDWVLKNRKAKGFRLVGGGTINVKTGTIRHTADCDPQPGDIVFFSTVKNSLKPAESLRPGYAGLNGDWGHVAIIGSDGRMHHDMGGEGYVWKYTPDSLLRRNLKYVKYGGYSYSYQVWRLSRSEIPSLSHEATVGGTGARETGRTEAAVLHDTVRIRKLAPRVSYVLEGTVYDQTTGKPYRNADGKTVTATKTFRADTSRKTITLNYTVNTSGMKSGTKLVLKSTLRRKGEKRILAASAEPAGEKAVITVLF